MVDRGGAQYRRIKKYAEESPNKPALVKGLAGVNNNLGFESHSKPKATSIAPHFYSHQSSNSRKGSIEMYFRKQIKAHEYNKKMVLNGEEFEVKCVGSKLNKN